VKLHVDVRTEWRFGKAGGRELELSLLPLLDGIEQTGKLTLAARSAGVSHRHAWNLIEKGSDFFGAPLVMIERGRGTQLSALGEVARLEDTPPWNALLSAAST